METDQFWDSPVFQVTDDDSMAPLDHRTMVTVTHGATVGGLDMYLNVTMIWMNTPF